MSRVVLPMASPQSLKRTYNDAALDESLHNSSMNDTSNNIPVAELVEGVHSSDPSMSNNIPPVKKVKLTFEEKEVQRIEKEFIARERAEAKVRKEREKAQKEAEKAEEKSKRDQEKAIKDAEKAKREEEKRAKEAAKEERRQVKEEQNRLRQEEKQQKEDEKNKKARNQLRLNAFFVQPSIPNGTSSGSPSHSPLSSRRSSITEIHAMEAQRRSRSVSLTPHKPSISDYERHFPPFFLQSHTVLAPVNRFTRDEQGLQYARQAIDEGVKVKHEGDLQSTSERTHYNINELLHVPPYKRTRRSLRNPTLKGIMAKIDGTTSNPIDLTASHIKQPKDRPMDMLKQIPMKFLKFAEDVRPPYIGTYTRLSNTKSMSSLARNPVSHGLPDTNYDYDSEAEWEEPIEGEDLDSEGEEEDEDEEEGNEMDGFLDDEDATAAKRRPVVGDMDPVCSGICWEGVDGRVPGLDIASLDRRLFRLDILLENSELPIDPYSTAYWQTSTPSKHHQAQGSAMQPPRIPLQPINRQSNLLSPSLASVAPNVAKSDPARPTKPQRIIPPEIMDDFKAAIQGNDLTKMGIVEVLKKQFPKQSKDTIKDTLDMIAERVGPTKLHKKWMLKSGF